jgi:hypothetical protein
VHALPKFSVLAHTPTFAIIILCLDLVIWEVSKKDRWLGRQERSVCSLGFPKCLAISLPSGFQEFGIYVAAGLLSSFQGIGDGLSQSMQYR